jgi:hypothetical protein
MATTHVPAGPITSIRAPWTTKATVYIIPFWTTRDAASNLPCRVYHPLEAESTCSTSAFGIPRGGLSMIHLIHYHASPVGPYYQMAICPGSFEYPVDDEPGTMSTETAMRATSVYVSQKHACWNGRKSKLTLYKPSYHIDTTTSLTPRQYGISPAT